jgi:hypothetical protein
MALAIIWLLMAHLPPSHGGAKKQSGWHDMGKGLMYAATSGVVFSLVMVFSLREFQAEVSTVFLPFFADDILHEGAEGFGYLNMAQGVGAFVGLFGIATLGNYRYKGRLIIGAGLACGFFLVLFPLSNSLLLSVVLLFAVNGAGIIFENVSRTALQTIVPDDMRGRVMSMREFAKGAFGTWVAFGLGVAGEYLGVVTASVLIGVFLLVSVSLLALSPSFRRL